MDEYFDHEASKRQRRNLTLMSVWMILFLLGVVGFQSDSTVNSPLLPFKVLDKQSFEVAMWVLFAYFWWRYSQYFAINLQIYKQRVAKRMYEDPWLNEICEGVVDVMEEYSNTKFERFDSSFFKRKLVFSFPDQANGAESEVDFDLPVYPTLMIELKHQCIAAAKEKSFSEFLLPHVLSFSVVCVGAWKYLHSADLSPALGF